MFYFHEEIVGSVKDIAYELKMVFYSVDFALKCIQMPPGALLQLLSYLGGGSVVVSPICSVCVWGFCVLVL